MGLFFGSGILNARKGIFKSSEVSTGNPNPQSDFTYEYVGNDVVITGYVGSRLDVVVPSVIDLKRVVAIGMEAFRGNTDITSVVLPNSLLDINEGAFRACSGLLSVQLPQLLRTIGNDAFRNCKLLQFSLALPSTLVSIGDSAFRNCNAQQTFVIPRNIQTIAPRTFEGCSELTSVFFDANCRITSIGASAFMNCGKLINTNISDMPLQSLGSQVFFGCSRIPSIALPSTLLSIDTEAFSFCSKLARFTLETPAGSASAGVFTVVDEVLFQNQNTILFAYPPAKALGSYTAPTSVTKVAPDAFNTATILTSIVLPNTVTEIGERAFSYCNNLSRINSSQATTFILPTSLVTIKAQAFRNLQNLVRLELPTTLQEIGEACFLSSVNLDIVIFKSIFPPTVLPSAFKSIKSTASGVYPQQIQGVNLWSTFTIEGLPLYETSTSASQFTYVQVDQTIEIVRYLGTTAVDVSVPSVINGLPVVAINTRAFANRLVRALIIPEGVLRIGDSAFEECTLTSIQLPTSLLTLGTRAFYRATQLTSVNIPPQITEILGYVFSYTTSLLAIVIPNTVRQVRAFAFAYSSLRSVTLPSSSGYGEYAFAGSGFCQSVVFQDGITSVPAGMFNTCPSLTSVTLPNSLTSIGSSGFSTCPGLRTITFPPNLTLIGSYAFSGTRLTSVTLPPSVRSVETGAFQNISSLLTVTFSSTSLSIGESAFQNATLLTSLVLPNGVSYIGTQAFFNCGLQSVTIGSGLTSVGEGAFYKCSQITSFTVSPQNLYFSSNALGWFNKNFSILYMLLPNLTGTVTLPTSITEIARYATAFCKFSNLILNVGVATIQSNNINDCPLVTSVFISRTVTRISGLDSSSAGIFNNCPLLTTITIDSANTVYTAIDNVVFNAAQTRILFFPKSRTGSYVMPTTITGASSTALQSLSLTSITLSPVFQVDANIFSNSLLLADVVLTEGIKYIEPTAFSGCPLITTLNIPSTATYVGDTTGASSFIAAINVHPQNLAYESLDGVLFTKDLVQLVLYPPKKPGTSYQIPNNTSMLGLNSFFRAPSTLKTLLCGSNCSSLPSSVQLGTFITKFVSSGKLSNMHFSAYTPQIEYYITTFRPPSLISISDGNAFSGKIFYANDASPDWDTFSLSLATVQRSPSLFVDTTNDFQTETSNGITKVTRYVGSLSTAVISENVL